MKAHRIIRTLLLLALCSTEVVLAQDKQNMFNPVNTSVTSLAIAPDARAGAMGDIGVATEADVYSQYWNPAKYPFNIARAGVGVSYTPWLRKLVNDINLANLTGFYRIGDYSAVHASLRYFSLGEVYLADMDDMTIKPYEMAIDAGYSRMLSETFSMAVNLRFILSDIKYDYTAESSAGKASRIKSSCQPCRPNNEVSGRTPASGAPTIVEINSDVSISEVALARSPAANQRGNNTE